MRRRPFAARHRVLPISVALAAALHFAACLPAAEPPPSGPFSLEVRVEDHRGRPLPEAEIELRWLFPGAVSAPLGARSDAGGRARLGGLAAGSWELTVRHERFMTFVAEVAVSAGKPQIVVARQENVRGATAPLRVRVARGPAAASGPRELAPLRAVPPPVRPAEPPSRPPESSPAAVAVPPPAPAVPAPATPVPPAPDASMAPPEAARPPAAPITDPGSAPPVAAPRPESAGAAPPLAPAEPPEPPSAPGPPALPDPPEVAPTPVPPELPPARVPVPAAAPGPAPAAAPAPVPRVDFPAGTVRRHADRSCPECPAGEGARSVERGVSAAEGGQPPCPPGALRELAGASPDSWDELARTLPAGCAALAMELPAGARYTGYRYESGTQVGWVDCPAGRDCPGLSASWLGDPVVYRHGTRTWLVALFANRAEGPRQARFTAYYRERRP